MEPTTDNSSTYRQWHFAAHLILIAILSSVTHASGSTELLNRQLINSQRQLLEVMTYFHLYQTSRGDKQYRRTLEDNLIACRDNLSLLRKQLNDSQNGEEADAINLAWQQIALAMNASVASLKRGGYVEPAIQERYRNAAEDLQLQLAQLRFRHFPASAGQQPSTPEEAALLAMMMQYLSLRYLDQQWHLAGEWANLELSQIRTQFDTRFQRLLAQTENRNDADQFSELYSKWQLLDRSMQSGSERPVTFLVTRYGQDIVDGLTGAF